MDMLWANGFPSSDWHEALNFILILVLLLSLLLLRPRSNSRPSAQAVPLALAARPQERVGVIVQEARTDSSVEELVARLGGTVTRDLPANAFAAELLELARAQEVRWVSLDAPVTRVGDPGSPDD